MFNSLIQCGNLKVIDSKYRDFKDHKVRNFSLLKFLNIAVSRISAQSYDCNYNRLPS